MKNSALKLILFTLLLSPVASWCQAFWGQTTKGGSASCGTIFKTDINGGSYQLKYSFPFSTGKLPYGDLLEASNGKMYGLTSEGGTSNLGTLFEFDPATRNYVVRASFNGILLGKSPMGSLIEGTNGKLYGITFEGGINNSGVLFEYDTIARVLTKKIDLNSPATGRDARGSLFLAANGLIYGMTSQGGPNGQGTLFEYDPVGNIFTVKVSFDGTNGSVPNGSLIQGTDGMLYGMSSYGGPLAYGVLFKYDIPNDTLIKLWEFDGAATGKNPEESLIQASNGNFYGMTLAGGINNVGCLFEWNPATSTLTKRHDFANATGSYPKGSLVQASNGLIYGMSVLSGYIFKFDPATNIQTQLLMIGGEITGNVQGSFIQASDGKLYAMSKDGGINGYGAIFTFDPVLNIGKRKWNFTSDFNGSDPRQGLVPSGHGTLLGVANYGGLYDLGTLFEFDTTTLRLSVLLDFDGVNMGSRPNAAPALASDGKFYGVTTEGGLGSNGIIYQYDPATGIVIKKLDFPNWFAVTLGRVPTMTLTEAVNGKLYGVTELGGPTDNGTIYEYDYVANTYTQKAFFSGANGRILNCRLLSASNGKLYGVTTLGGQYDDGTLFEYDPIADTLIKKADFNSATTGRYPEFQTLTEKISGMFYGVAHQGGSNNTGILFEYNLQLDTLIRRHTFLSNGSDGYYPWGTLVPSPNGRLIGMNYSGGSIGYGTIFSYQPATSYQTTSNLNLTTGGYPYNELCYTSGTPFVVLQSSGGTYCEHTSFFLSVNASGGSLSYQWFQNGNPVNGATTNYYFVSAALLADAGNYACEIYSSTDTIYSTPVSIQILSTPVVILTASDTTLCQGDSVMLSASGAQSYLWNPSILPSTYFTPSSSSTYNVIGTGSNGCTDTSSLFVSVNPFPIVTLNLSQLDTQCVTTNVIALSGGSPVGGIFSGQSVIANNFNPSAAGLGTFGINYVYTDNNGCSSQATDSISVLACTGIYSSDNNLNGFEIYPNPTNAVVTIRFPNLLNYKIEIFNSIGQKVYNKEKISAEVFQVDFTEMPSGIYFCTIRLEGKIVGLKKILVN